MAKIEGIWLDEMTKPMTVEDINQTIASWDSTQFKREYLGDFSRGVSAGAVTGSTRAEDGQPASD